MKREIITRFLNPIFNSSDICPNLFFVRCSLGYDGNVNLLFADGKYDYLKVRRVKNIDPVGHKNWGYRIVKNYKIYPSSPQNYKLIILGNNNHIVEFNNKKINYTHAMQIDADTYCFVCHTIDERFKKNVKLTNNKGKIIAEFTIGTGVSDIQTNENHELWASYTDYGINTNYFDISHEYTGLNCFDTSGHIVYKYDHEPSIDECESLNVISQNEVLVNIYSGSLRSWLALGEIIDKNIVNITKWRKFTHFMAYSNNKILVEGSDYLGDNSSIFTLIDIKEDITELNIYKFFNKEGNLLKCIHGQGDSLYFFDDNLLYKVSINEL